MLDAVYTLPIMPHDIQADTVQAPAPSLKASPLSPRPFEVTFPGQGTVSSPDNPFPRRPHETWSMPPSPIVQTSRDSSETASEGETTRLEWKPFRLYAEGQTPPSPPKLHGVQAKLTIGQPNDQYEQEADRVAEQVMSMPDSATQQPIQRETAPEEEVQTKPLVATITPLVQREAMPGEEEELQTKTSENIDIQRMDNLEEEEIQTKPGAGTVQREAMPEEEALQTKPLANTLQRHEMPEGEEAVQTKPSLQRAIDGSLQVGGNLESRLNSRQGGGSPLPQDVKTFMESRFRTDFSQVRVHTDGEAVQMNRDLNAHAFTHKQDVYFGAGKAPGKDALTAHELTHVVQQTSGMNRKQVLPKLIQRKSENFPVP
ncbi:MAG: DUF4157 domain-containing protein, partial [Leptolyngbyaceae cyanobacterium bins.59]|nr:DUF4157 domain-containing protein [Leptolyngbyaceae cyanobacterium bins.59]